MSDQYTLSLSYGKDSLACLGAIEKLGWSLDRIIHAEVWATDTVPAELPPMVEFKLKADEIIKRRYGIKVEHFRAKYTFEQAFYLRRGRTGRKTKHEGELYGWPLQKGQWCLQQLKRPVFDISKGITYVGIASDEPGRFHDLSDRKISPLVEIGWDEAMCRRWCKENDLLSPIYTTATRGGCWFCHNQSLQQLRLLRKSYPDYWALMLRWDLDSPTTFHSDGHTIHDLEKRFQMEDDGYINPNDRSFRWSMIDEDFLYRQIKLDDYMDIRSGGGFS